MGLHEQEPTKILTFEKRGSFYHCGEFKVCAEGFEKTLGIQARNTGDLIEIHISSAYLMRCVTNREKIYF